MALKGKQLKFLMALIEYDTVEEAIEKAGIARSTAYRYLNDENFKRERLKAQTEAMSRVTARLQHGSNIAVNTILELMTDKKTPAPTRLSSARAILENAYRGLELEQVLQILEEIENNLEENI